MARHGELEYQEQVGVMEWAALMSHNYPALELLHHVPNGGDRDVRVAVKMKRSGVKRGIPDLLLPAQRRGYAGLYLEMKRVGGEKPDGDQARAILRLRAEGYLVVVCYGQWQAIEWLEWYVGITEMRPTRGDREMDVKDNGSDLYRSVEEVGEIVKARQAASASRRND